MWHAVTLQLSNSPELPPMLQETKVSIHHQHKPRQTHLEFTYSMTKFKSTRGASILATSVSLRSRPCLFWTCFSSKFPAKQDLLACVRVIAGKCRDSICLKLNFFSTEFFPTKTGMERRSKSHVKLSLFTRDRNAKLQCLGVWTNDPRRTQSSTFGLTGLNCKSLNSWKWKIWCFQTNIEKHCSITHSTKNSSFKKEIFLESTMQCSKLQADHFQLTPRWPVCTGWSSPSTRAITPRNRRLPSFLTKRGGSKGEKIALFVCQY